MSSFGRSCLLAFERLVEVDLGGLGIGCCVG